MLISTQVFRQEVSKEHNHHIYIYLYHSTLHNYIHNYIIIQVHQCKRMRLIFMYHTLSTNISCFYMHILLLFNNVIIVRHCLVIIISYSYNITSIQLHVTTIKGCKYIDLEFLPWIQCWLY